MLHQLGAGHLGQIHRAVRTGGDGFPGLVSDPDDPPDPAVFAIHSGGVRLGVMVTGILVVPVHDPECPVGPGLDRDGAEPRILGDEKISAADFEVAFGRAEQVLGLAGFEGGAEGFEPIQIQRALMDVPDEGQPLP